MCSTRNVELVRSLGADHVIDYTREDFTAGTQQYDLIIDNVGNQDFLDLRRVVKPTGTIVTVSGPKTNNFLGPISRIVKQKMIAPFIDQKLVFFVANIGKPELELFARLMQEGKLKTVIDRRYPLEQAGAALDYIGGRTCEGQGNRHHRLRNTRTLPHRARRSSSRRMSLASATDFARAMARCSPSRASSSRFSSLSSAAAKPVKIEIGVQLAAQRLDHPQRSLGTSQLPHRHGAIERRHR